MNLATREVERGIWRVRPKVDSGRFAMTGSGLMSDEEAGEVSESNTLLTSASLSGVRG